MSFRRREVKKSYARSCQNRKNYDGKTVVKLFTQDGVREILVPSQQPKYHNIVLQQSALISLQEKATKKKTPDASEVQERAAMESMQRKAKFIELDRKATSKKSCRLRDAEQEAKEKSSSLLKRAWELRMEQEDEIKAANSLILKTKCQAIRDAQLAEHSLVKKKLKEDEQRTEMDMEKQRVEKLIEEARQAEIIKCQKEQYVKELSKQIEVINEKRIIDSEKIIQERKNLNQVMYMLMMDEVQKMKANAARKSCIREEINKANEQIRKAHEIEKEEERLADLRVQEWMKQRAEREQALEQEQMENRKRREREIARLRSMQEKAGELQAKQDEMAAVRRQEEYEREWRKKEKLAAEKKRKEQDKCNEIRYKQLEEFRQIQAMEIAREKIEFENIVKLQREAEERERLRDLKRKHDAEKFREDLLRQMNEKESELIARRSEELAEGMTLRLEDARRVNEIQKILTKKVQQLKMNKVPEMYISDIMRQLHLADNSSESK